MTRRAPSRDMVRISCSSLLVGIAIRDRDDSGLNIDSLTFYNKRQKLAAIPFSFLACSICVGPSSNGNNFCNLEGTRMCF